MVICFPSSVKTQKWNLSPLLKYLPELNQVLRQQELYQHIFKITVLVHCTSLKWQDRNVLMSGTHSSSCLTAQHQGSISLSLSLSLPCLAVYIWGFLPIQDNFWYLSVLYIIFPGNAIYLSPPALTINICFQESLGFLNFILNILYISINFWWQQSIS